MNTMKKNRKKERLVAWLVFGTIILIILAGLCVGGMFAYGQYSEYRAQKKALEEKAEAERIEMEETQKALEEAEKKALEEAAASAESFDQDSLDAIFSDEEETEEVVEEETEDEELLEQVADIVESMTIEQKVAQLFFIRPEAITDVDVCTAAGEKTKAALNDYPVGGIIYFADNIEDPEQLSEMTKKLQSYAEEIEGVPVFIGIDEEGGSVTRIAQNDNFEVAKFDTMEEIGALGDTEKAYEAGNEIGKYLAEYGFNVNFAPDADVITVPDNAIGDRSFGSDANAVSQMVLSYARGLSDAGILACAKHYPDHGAVSEDTHKESAIIDKSWDELEDNEIIPFKEVTKEKIPFIMVSHICVPAVTVDEIPSSLSGLLITDKLRGTIGYQGIIITDSLSMGAISDNYSSKEAAVKALQAGVDMLLMPKDFKEAYEGVLGAIEEGTISEERINESVVRIIKEKLKLNGENNR